jgi:hypothetical protein
LLHIANTNFEDELRDGNWSENHIRLQLEFLPTLFATEDDAVIVTSLPLQDYLSRVPLKQKDDDLNGKVESWGPSKTLQSWCQAKKLSYDIPDLGIVREVNSKAFSFQMSPKLKSSALLFTHDDITTWALSFDGPKVLKSCFGVSGRGHLHFPWEDSRLKSFTEKEGFPLIGEPWLHRKLDFSTQWLIKDNNVIYLGPTICVSDKRGKHVGNLAGHLNIPFLEEHIVCAKPILHQMREMGYFGHVGIDAFIDENDSLHPIVEINARKTMGFVTLKIQQDRFIKETVSVSYLSGIGPDNHLPNEVIRGDGTVIRFKRKLVIEH